MTRHEPTRTSRWPLCLPGVFVLALGASAMGQGTFLEPDVTVIHTFQGTGGSFGWAVAQLDDIDNPPDGVMDLIIPAPGQNTVWVYSGQTGAILHVLAAPAGAANFGNAVGDAGDANGDGVHDIVVGAPGGGFGANPGGVYIFSGADGTLLTFAPGESSGDQMGFGVGGVGDVNGDGFDDVVGGAPGHDTVGNNAGRAYVISGLDGSFIHVMDGESAGDGFGIGAAGTGDLNGDGIGDVIVGASNAGANGKAYVYSGADGSLLFDTSGEPGASAYGQFFVSGVGDTNNDGTPDVYVGDFASNAGNGKAYVYSGVDGTPLHVFPGTSGEGVGPGRGTNADVNGDGAFDLLIGHWQNDAGGTNAGRVTIRSGTNGTILRTITSTTPTEALGFDAVGIGDVNNDGFTDLLLSAASNNRVYVIAGIEIQGCLVAEPPESAAVVDGNRYLAMVPPPSGAPSAIRVTLTDLAGFPGSNGEARWVGLPTEYPDVELGTTFSASQLQCDPFFFDWSGIDLLYVFGSEVVPSSTYAAQSVASDCGASPAPSDFSEAITVTTPRWGDIVPPFWTPGAVQPNFVDVTAIVQSFLISDGAPNKPRAQLQPSIVNPTNAISFQDVSQVVSAFLSEPYPFAGPTACAPGSGD